MLIEAFPQVKNVCCLVVSSSHSQLYTVITWTQGLCEDSGPLEINEQTKEKLKKNMKNGWVDTIGAFFRHQYIHL